MEQSFAIIPILMFLFFGVFAVVVLAFWVWMLVDCVTNEPSEGNDKIVWLLVIILAGWVGALIYLIVRRPQRRTKFGC